MKPTPMFYAIASFCLVAPISFSMASATTWNVLPDGTGDYPTIPAVVDGSVDGDVIELASGIFTGPGNTDVNTNGLAITIRSAFGSATDETIDCQDSSADPHRGFTVASGEGPGTVIEGFPITGGYGYPGGIPSAGAVLVANSSQPTIRDCVFVDNHLGSDQGYVSLK